MTLHTDVSENDVGKIIMPLGVFTLGYISRLPAYGGYNKQENMIHRPMGTTPSLIQDILDCALLELRNERKTGSIKMHCFYALTQERQYLLDRTCTIFSFHCTHLPMEAPRTREYRIGVSTTTTNRIEVGRDQNSRFFSTTRMGLFLL